MEAGTGGLPDPAPASPTRGDWSEMPLDALVSIFTKLDLFDILMGAGLVCHSWLDAAKVPSLWRRADMAPDKVMEERFIYRKNDVLCAMAKLAADRSSGQLQEFSGKRFVTAELLNYIGDRAPSLKTLRLTSSYLDLEGFAEAIKKFPLLEELELKLCTCVQERDVYKIVAKACPLLKSFKQMNRYTGLFDFDLDADLEHDDGTLEDIYNSRGGEDEALTGLHTLQLFGSELSNRELTAIMDRCPHLESLDIRRCFRLKMDTPMKARLASLKTLWLPSDPIDDYEELIIDNFHGWHEHFAS